MSWILSIGLTTIALVVVGVLFALLIASRLIRGKADQLMVVTGWIGKNKSSIIQHGGLRFVWPIIQQVNWLPLRPYTVNIKLDGALSKENIRVSLPCTFIVGVDAANTEVMQHAAVRIIDVIDDEREFRNFIQELVFGQMRAVISNMTIEEINADRKGFQEAITNSVSTEIAKVGLDLISVNIQDIRDDADYIVNLGKKAAAEAQAKAVVAIAEQEKVGASGKTTYEAEQRQIVAENNYKAVAAENDANKNVAASNADLVRVQTEVDATNRSKAAIVASDAEREARLVEAENKRKVFEAQAATAKAQEVLEIAKAKVEAAPEAERLIISEKAKGEADGERERQRLLKEAEGIQAMLEAKATGVKKLVDAANGDPMAAVLLAMNEQVPEILTTYAKSIADRRIDNLVCINNGSSENSNGSLANLTRDLLSQVPQAKEVLGALGFSLPKKIESKPEILGD